MSHVCSMRVVKHNGCDKQCVSGVSAPSFMMACLSMLYHGAENDYTHTHTHLLHMVFFAGIILCNSGSYEGTFCERANYT